MKDTLSKTLIAFAEKLPRPLYIVGGRVRDFIANLQAGDIDTDLCSPVSAEEFSRVAEELGIRTDATYKNTGTVKITVDGEWCEYTCFRSDEYVRGEHRPAATYFTDDINLDARRRDFKCNAVYYDIAADKFVDPLGGIDDIKAKRITTVAPAKKVFGEDGLRLMRLARIAAQTGFAPDSECLKGARDNSELIKDISVERIFAELWAILYSDLKYGCADGPYRGLKILQEIEVLEKILPELYKGAGLDQRKDFHKYDVLEHSLRAVKYSPEKVRFAALLHDIGKPYCYERNGKFAGHEEEGARIARNICARLKVSKNLTEETAQLIALHMYDLRCDAKVNKARKFIVKNYAILDKLFMLKQADYSACMDQTDTAPFVQKYTEILAEMRAEGVPFTLKELKLKGDALIKAGFAPAEVGKTLENLLYDCCIGQVENDTQKLLDRALKIYLRTDKG
ncbi:MAG: HD domain-containing protein [Clostridiales bacterium]|nr:HD domain-containing protein [Clostridiales bacterium]